MNKGILHLALRNPKDEREARTVPATMAQLRFHQEKPFDMQTLWRRLPTRPNLAAKA